MAEPGAAEPVWPLLRTLVGVGLACAVLVVGVYELTRERIATNRAERLRAAIGEVLPGAVSVLSFRRRPDGGFQALPALAGGDDVVHACFDADGRVLGFAFEGRGPGYQDAIEVLLGYDAGRERVTGLAVLASRETPGLGDRIRSDGPFLASFRDLDVSLAAGGAALAHGVSVVPPGRARRPWQVDGISGATVSSRAVARIVGAAAADWAPWLRADPARFEEAVR